MTAEVPRASQEPMTPEERRAENLLNGGGFNQFGATMRETGLWPKAPTETSAGTSSRKPRARKHKPGDNFRGEGPDGDSLLDPNWTAGLEQSRTVEEEAVIKESLAQILAQRQSEDRQRRIAAGEKPELIDAAIRAKQLRRQRGYLG